MLGDPAPHRAHRLERSRPARRPVRVRLPLAGAVLSARAGRCRRRRCGRGRRRCRGGGATRAVGSGAAAAPRPARGRQRRLDEGEDVLLRHAAVAAGARRPSSGRCRARPRSARRPGRRSVWPLPLVAVARRAGRPARTARARGTALVASGSCARLRLRRRLGGLGAPASGSTSDGLRIAARLGCGRAAARSPGRSGASERPDRRPSRPPGRGSPAGRRCRGSAPRCRPCRSRSRAASRRPATVSPTCLSQRVTVPSETETPICGITTSTTVPVAI